MEKSRTRNAKTLTGFSTSSNPHGPNNIKIRKKIYLLLNDDNLWELYPKGVRDRTLST